MQLELISYKRNKFRIRRLALRIADGIAEKSLQSVQVASVPGYFDGMSDGPFHSAGGGLECLGHLRVQYLGDGVGVPCGPPEGPCGMQPENPTKIECEC